MNPIHGTRPKAPGWRQRLAGTAVALITQLAWVAPAGAGVVEEAFDAARRALGGDAAEATLEIVTDRATTIAMAAAYRAGECSVYLLETSAYLTEALRSLEPASRRPYLEALFAHELAHCEDMQAARATPGLLGVDGTPADGVTAYRRPDGSYAVAAEPRSVLWAEVLADATLALYLAERHPALAASLTDFHLSRRALRAEQDPDHDTSAFLRGRDFRRHEGESVRDAALRIRLDGSRARDPLPH